jgi:two-component system chemotaxis sensor kinase CheA
MVARLEEIPVGDVEKADGKEVVQYRGHIMPLIRLSEMLGADDETVNAEQMQVVVYAEGERSVGLVVDRILDIVETGLEVRRATGHAGIVASAVIQQCVTDLLDVQAIIRAADPNFCEPATAV